ncbi:unnamed protein product [Hapterophycus canaliculatus]
MIHDTSLDLPTHLLSRCSRLEWPLHLVLTRETMQTYNRLFRLLASVKKASLELERVWPMLMQSRYRGLAKEEKAWLGPLWMLRARMAFFTSNLVFYLQVGLHVW